MSKEVFFIDHMNSLWHGSLEETEKNIRKCEEQCNNLLKTNGKVSLYEVYNILGLIDEKSEEYLSKEYVHQLKTTVWEKDKDGQVSFNTKQYVALELTFDIKETTEYGQN